MRERIFMKMGKVVKVTNGKILKIRLFSVKKCLVGMDLIPVTKHKIKQSFKSISILKSFLSLTFNFTNYLFVFLGLLLFECKSENLSHGT